MKAPSAENVVQRRALSSDVILEYKDESEFRGIAQQLGIFEEWKVDPLNSFPMPVFFSHRSDISTP